MRQEIKRITGRQVREAAAEIETATGTVVHAFTTRRDGASVSAEQGVLPDTGTDSDSTDRVERADDDGLRVAPDGLSADEGVVPMKQ